MDADDRIVLLSTPDEALMNAAMPVYAMQRLQVHINLTQSQTRPSTKLFTASVERNRPGYIGVDFDGTLVHYDHGSPGLGEPLQPMVDRLWAWLRSGVEVRIITARAEFPSHRREVEDYLLETFSLQLPVQNFKTYQMIELWDDRAIQVVPNTGMTPQEYLAYTRKQNGNKA